MTNNQLEVKEQEEIINSEGKNLIISASAGSGKTSVMIRKILKHILSGECHVEELLVLTYTNASALEMKKKLVDKLRENVDNSPFLQEELDMVQSSDISTFDSFCQKLIKKYFYVLNIDPSFGILEGGEQNYYQGLALEKAIKTLKKENPESYELLLENFAPKRNEEKIKEIILQIYNYTTSLLKIEDFIQKNRNFYKKNSKIAENYLNNYYNSVFVQFKNNFEYLKTKCNKLNFNGYVLYTNNILIELDRLISEKRFSKKLDLISEVKYGILKQEKTDQIGFREAISKQKDKLKKVLDAILLNFVDANHVDNSYEKCGKLCDVIFILLNIFIDKYTQIKTKINLYDFNDIERLTIRLLEKEEICEEIKNSYKYIFVDEFQDANAVQERIIFLLSKNNLFFVGDTKQSIYAFRQSDPEIFLAIEEKFTSSENGEAKTLNCNFRTNKNILYFVNEVFNVVMTKETADLNYREKAQFDPKAPYEDLEDEINVSLNIINKKTKPEKKKVEKIYSTKEHSGKTNLESEYDDECSFICGKVLSSLGERIYDKELGKVRQVGLSDISILVSKRGAFLNTLCKHFDEVGIAYTLGANQNLEELYDNMVLYNLLKYTVNSKDDYTLYSILTSPLFNFSDSELAYIKQANIELENFYEAFASFNEECDTLYKIRAFNEVIEHFEFEVKYKGIYFALSQIIKKTNYLLNISFEENFQNRKINIEEYITSFSGSKFDNDLSGYLIYRETALRSQKVQGESKTIDAIEINTMHSSKGLEYPIVILPNLDADNFRSPQGNEIKINKDFGVGLKAYNDDDREVSNGIFYESCKLKNREIEQSEKIRLLYVAMTRAKNKLILVGRNCENYIRLENAYEIKQSNNFLNLIVGSLPEDIIEKINNRKEFTCNMFNNSKMQLNILNIDSVNISRQEVVLPKKSDEKYVDALAEYWSKDLKVQHKDIALKNSVSEFSFDENASINFAPKNMTISEHLSEKASDRGTLYHKILEKIDFNNVNSEEDVKQFINCNFSKEQIDELGGFSIKNIYNNICIIKGHIDNGDRVLKEQKFVMQVPYCEVGDKNIQDKILVQGIIDLLIIKKDQIILIDYKLTNKSNEYIKEKYNKQLSLYELAIRKGFKDKKINSYILNLNKNQIINY